MADHVTVPREPTDAMLAAALQASLDFMTENGVNALSPFETYPSPTEAIRRAYRAMVAAGTLN